MTELDDVLADLQKDDPRPRFAGTLEIRCANYLRSHGDELRAALEDARRLDYIERTYSGMTNRERYLPVQMIWGKGCNGRTLREACDKYMKRDAAIDAAQEVGRG